MRTVKLSELSLISMVAGKEEKYKKIIHDGKVKEWVGTGWIEIDEKPDKRKHWTVEE